MPFEKGNKVNAGRRNPNAGRKPNALKERLNSVFNQNVSDTDLQEIVKRAVEDAKDGNATARDFLFDRMFGKPISELDRVVIAAIQNERGKPPDAEA